MGFTFGGSAGGGGGLKLRTPPDVFSGPNRNAAVAARNAGLDAAALAEFNADPNLAIILRIASADTYQVRRSGAWHDVTHVVRSTVPGSTGAGVPTGGAVMDLLFKTGAADHATGWRRLMDMDIPASISRDSEVAAAITAAITAHVDTNAHDSGSSPASHLSQDNRRITRLEQLASDLSLRTHEGWGNVTSADSGAVAAVLLANFSIDQDTVVAFDYVTEAVIPADGSYGLVLRVPAGNNVNSYQLSRTGSSTDPLHGVFHGGSFTRGGFDYYFLAGSVALSQNDRLQVQSVQNLLDHTVYGGEVTKLDEHAAEPYAHQDNPPRVDHLDINAPVGREVYLTELIHHPGTEHIFNFDLGLLGPNRPDALGVQRPSFVGASLLDFSGEGGPVATADTSGLPAVFNAARIAGIFESTRETFFTVAVNKAISADAPTHINIGYLDPMHPDDQPRTGLRVALTQHGADIVKGGNTYRLMRSTGSALADYYRNRTAHGTTPTLYFSLEYPDGFIEVDGSLDTGSVQLEGVYEHVGGGVWETRGTAIAREIGATNLAVLPTIDLELAAAGGDANDLVVGDRLTNARLPLRFVLGADSTEGVDTYFALSSTPRTVLVKRSGFIFVNGLVRGTLTSGNAQHGRMNAVVRRTRGAAVRDFDASAPYLRRSQGGDAVINYGESPISRLVPVQQNDLISIVLIGHASSANARPTLTASNFEVMWMGGIKGETGEQGEPRILSDGESVVYDRPVRTYTPSGGISGDGIYTRTSDTVLTLGEAEDAATRAELLAATSPATVLLNGDERRVAIAASGANAVTLTVQDGTLPALGGDLVLRLPSTVLARANADRLYAARPPGSGSSAGPDGSEGGVTQAAPGRYRFNRLEADCLL